MLTVIGWEYSLKSSNLVYFVSSLALGEKNGITWAGFFIEEDGAG